MDKTKSAQNLTPSHSGSTGLLWDESAVPNIFMCIFLRPWPELFTPPLQKATTSATEEIHSLMPYTKHSLMLLYLSELHITAH